MTVVVVVLSLLVLFLAVLAMDYWHRWRNEKLWADHLKGLLALTRQELVVEKQKHLIERSCIDGTSEN